MVLVPFGAIAGIMALAGALRGLFSGGGGGDGENEVTREQQMFMRRLLPQLEGQLGLERVQGLRSSFLSDPELAGMIDPTIAAQLGLSPELINRMATGGVPLQRAVMNLAFGLLPRFARTTVGPGPFAGTPELQALHASSPANRLSRQGPPPTTEPFRFSDPGGGVPPDDEFPPENGEDEEEPQGILAARGGGGLPAVPPGAPPQGASIALETILRRLNAPTLQALLERLNKLQTRQEI